MTLTMKTSGRVCFGKVGTRRRARPNPFYVPDAPKSNTSEICDADEIEVVEEIVEAAPESRPDFNPPNEERLRKLAREVVQGYRCDTLTEELLPIVNAYARISNPGSQDTLALEHYVLVELRRYVSVVKALPVRPNAQQIVDELMRYGLNLPLLIKAKLENAVMEPSNATELPSGEKVYQITIGSKRCYIKAERNGQIRLIGLMTERDLKDLRTKSVRSRKDTFRRHVPANTR